MAQKPAISSPITTNNIVVRANHRPMGTCRTDQTPTSSGSETGNTVIGTLKPFCLFGWPIEPAMGIEPLNTETLQHEWNELFGPLPAGFEFLGVVYDPPWVTPDGDPAGGNYEWYFADTEAPAAYSRDYWDLRQSAYTWVADVVRNVRQPGAGCHIAEFRYPTVPPQYPSDLFSWWPSREVNTLFEVLERAAATDADRFRQLLDSLGYRTV